MNNTKLISLKAIFCYVIRDVKINKTLLMPENWKTYKLGDISEIIMGQSPKGATTNNLGEGIALLNGPTEFGYSYPTPTQFTIDPKKISKKGDLLFCVRGSTTGKMNFSDQPYAIGRGIGAFRGKNGFSTKYIKYLIDFYLDRMLAMCTGSTFPNLSRSDLENYNVKSCLPKESNSIASILSALDDKIELNLQMNKTLKEMAMALYKHWFVDFGPFQDGEFVDSELGEIPKGWEVKRLDEIALKKSESFNFKNKEEVVFVNTGDVQEGRFLHSNQVSKKGLPGQAKKAIAKGDILYSEIRPKNKRFAYVNFDSEDYVVSTKFMIINPKDNILSKLLYRILTMQSTVDNLNSIAEGRSGTFPQITFDAISDIEFVLPPISVQQKFQEIVSPLEMNQDELYLENQTLTQLRDTLLPKLISGEVRVKDAEKTLSEIL